MAVEQLIFTDCARSKGVDPSRAGYQIRACSPGVSARARELLESVSVNYGKAVYSFAPRAAREKHDAWRRQAQSIQAVPEEILSEFPVIWSYDQIGDELFALTRVCYSGFTHDGREGSFFAHALIFEPQAIAAHGYNPLSLARSGLFLNRHTNESTELPALPDPGKPTAEPAKDQPLRATPLAERLPAMLTALCTATPSNRPVALCVDDWRRAASIVESLLNLLPPSARSRTTFSTYESDRNWLPATKEGRPKDWVAPHHLFILCGAEDRAFNLRPDEYQTKFVLFNYVGNQFSPANPTRPYAAFAVDCLTRQQLPGLQCHHEIVERLGCGQNADAWDALLPAANLRDGGLQMENVASGLRAITEVAKQPKQAKAALELLLPVLRPFAAAGEPSKFKPLIADVAALVDRLLAPDQTSEQGFVHAMRGLIQTACAEGRFRTAAALASGCGQSRDRIVLAVVGDLLKSPQKFPASSNREEQTQWCDLLLDALARAEKMPEGAPPRDRLLVATFQAAGKIERVADVWKRAGESFAKQHLNGELDDAKRKPLLELIACVPVDQCPEGSVWLNMRFIEATKPQGDELMDRLRQCAEACPRCASAVMLTDDLLRIAQERLSDHEQLATALGCMAEAARDSAAGAKFFTVYREEMKNSDAKVYKIRRRLADAGVVHVMCEEFLAEVLPWGSPESSRKLQQWREKVLNEKPALLDKFCQHVADQLQRPEKVEATLPLARALIENQPKKAGAPMGLRALSSAIVLTLPIQPLAAEWEQSFSSEDGLSPEGQARLRILQFMGYVQKSASRPEWATTKFPHTDTAWKRDARELKPAQKQEVKKWCIHLFNITGVTTPEEAGAFVEMLEAIDDGSEESVATALGELMNGRDKVTRILAATAFARCALEGDKHGRYWADHLAAIVKQLDEDLRYGLARHLEKRFRRRDDRYGDRLIDLCERVGLPLPKPPPKAAGPSVAEEKSEAETDSVVGKIKGFGRKLFGGSKDSDQ